MTSREHLTVVVLAAMPLLFTLVTYDAFCICKGQHIGTSECTWANLMLLSNAILSLPSAALVKGFYQMLALLPFPFGSLLTLSRQTCFVPADDDSDCRENFIRTRHRGCTGHGSHYLVALLQKRDCRSPWSIDESSP